MRGLRTVAIFIVSGARTQLIYGYDFFLDFLLQIVANGMRIAVIEAVLVHTPTLAGWTRPEIETLFAVTLILSFAVGVLSAGVRDFIHYFHLGRLDALLSQPTSVSALIFLRWCRPLHAIACLATMILTAFILAERGVHFSVGNTLAALSVFLFSVGVTTLLYANLYLTSIFARRRLPMDLIFQQLFRFSALPIDLLPRNLLQFALLVPVILCGSVTAQILTRGSSAHLNGLLLAGGLMFLIYIAILRSVRYRIAGLGG